LRQFASKLSSPFLYEAASLATYSETIFQLAISVTSVTSAPLKSVSKAQLSSVSVEAFEYHPDLVEVKLRCNKE
jgi:hypothetical protein